MVNSGDLLPQLPPEPFFSHSGKRIIVRDHCRDSSGRSWFSQRVAALRVFVKLVGQTFYIADNHRLNAGAESYIPRLRADHAREKDKKTDWCDYWLVLRRCVCSGSKPYLRYSLQLFQAHLVFVAVTHSGSCDRVSARRGSPSVLAKFV